MAKLVLSRQGRILKTLDLSEDRKYTVGRSGDCDLVLEARKLISRKHLSIYFEKGHWKVKCISKVGNLFSDNEQVSHIELGESQKFSIPPFDFSFETEESETERPPNQLAKPTERQPAFLDVDDDTDSTPVASLNLVPFLKIQNKETSYGTIVELDGDFWVGGRDESCEIPINDNHASRRHFEVTKKDGLFFIQDLGSSNGTLVNGHPIPSTEPTRLTSGDVIEVLSVTLNFEVRDRNFEDRYDSAKKYLVPIEANHQLMHSQGYYTHPNMATGAYDIPPKTFLDHVKNFDYKKHKIRILLGALIPILIVGLMSDKKKTVTTKDSASKAVTMESLSPEQRASIKDLFNLAQQHFQTLRYGLCISELDKLHAIIPAYENSRQLKDYCEQGAALLRQEQNRKAVEQQRKETEQRIAIVVDNCRNKYPNIASIPTARTCLAPAIELDPEHHLVNAWLEEIEFRVTQSQQRQAEARQRALRNSEGRRKLQVARALKQQNHLNKAISAYTSFLNQSYPGLTSEKTLARRELASIRKSLKAKVDKLISSCQSLKEKGNHKDAWLTCNLATKEDPNNQEAKQLKSWVLSDLKREMKTIYQDSILEESLGNVDSAKEKWKVIRQKDLKFNTYYKKATRKLKKYGEGI